MNESSVALPTGTSNEEVAVLEEVTEPVASDLTVARRQWNHGSTQTPDDMYLGGLMCE